MFIKLSINFCATLMISCKKIRLFLHGIVSKCDSKRRIIFIFVKRHGLKAWRQQRKILFIHHPSLGLLKHLAVHLPKCWRKYRPVIAWTCTALCWLFTHRISSFDSFQEFQSKYIKCPKFYHFFSHCSLIWWWLWMSNLGVSFQKKIWKLSVRPCMLPCSDMRLRLKLKPTPE